jgi:drug/metabolite transporter (DMT)-like permease
MVLLGAIWGASFLFMRVAAPEFGPIALIHVRVLVASVFLVSIVFAQRRMHELFRNPIKLSIVALSGSAIPFSLFAYGTLTLSAGLSSVLNATVPFFGALIAMAFFREPIPASKWLGLCIAFLGVCALAWDKIHIKGGVWAISACLLAAVCYGFSAHYSKRSLGHMPPLVVAAGSQLMSSLWMLPVTVWFIPQTMPSLKGWSSAIALGVLCTGVALAIYFHLLSLTEATRVMTVAYLIPLFGIFWGMVFLGESLTISSALGGALVLLGLFLFNRRT